MNNSGIYNGLDGESWKAVTSEENLGLRSELGTFKDSLKLASLSLVVRLSFFWRVLYQRFHCIVVLEIDLTPGNLAASIKACKLPILQALTLHSYTMGLQPMHSMQASLGLNVKVMWTSFESSNNWPHLTIQLALCGS